MQITINLRIGLDDDAKTFLGGLMSAFSDELAVLATHVDAAVARVQTDVSGLTTKIDALQAKVDAGGASPEDLAALQALVAKVDAIDPATPSVLPTPVPAPGPSPAPA